MKQAIGLKVFVAVVVAAVATVVGIGLYLSGTPSQARALRADQQRVNQLQQISGAVENYYVTKSVLPTTLDDLKNQHGYFESLADPVTHEVYAYRVASSTEYELCATFQTDSTKDNTMQASPAYPVPVGFGIGNTWQHAVGKKCFELNVNASLVKPQPPVG